MNSRNDQSNQRRRSLLKGFAVLAGAAVLPVSKKAASAKAPQSAVQYQDKPKGEQRCDNCAHFEAPNACKVVEGKIAPEGWCSIWVKTP